MGISSRNGKAIRERFDKELVAYAGVGFLLASPACGAGIRLEAVQLPVAVKRP